MTPRTLTTHRSRSSLRGRRIHAGIAGLLVFSALAVLLLGATACSSTRPATRQLDDAAITAKVKTKITADEGLNPFKIDVDTLDGVVTLRGVVASEQKAAEAVKLARYTEGVINVENDLRIHRDMDTADRVDDATLESEVGAELKADAQVKEAKIDVDVKDGVVTLSGLVKSHLIRTQAEQVAKGVDGVRRVINDLRVS